jgi:hypothetical protein
MSGVMVVTCNTRLELLAKRDPFSLLREIASERYCPTTLRSAASSIDGNFFPRLLARRRIPAHAFGLKEYRAGTSRLSSSVSDNKHTLASLGQSEVLSVQHPPCEPIPEFCQRPREGSHRPSSVRRQDTGDIFPDHPARSKNVNQSAEVQREASASPADTGSESCDGEVLARGSSDEDVEALGGVNRVSWAEQLREVAIVGHSGVALGKQSGAERVDLGEERRPPPESLPCDRSGFNAGTDGTVSHSFLLHFRLGLASLGWLGRLSAMN